MNKSKYRRVLLKLSGEALKEAGSTRCVDAGALDRVAQSVVAVAETGAEVAIVVGGGNIFRGLAGGERAGVARGAGDYMGMLATMINGLALQQAFEKAGVEACVMSGLPMLKAVELFDARRAVRHLELGRLVIFVGGTGNPFFSTDTAAALRACEVGADVLIKATKVDGVYTADPVADRSARRLDRLTYREALERSLRIMDATAFSLCMENAIPIIVLNFFEDGSIRRAVCGEQVGTVVSA